MQVKADVVIAGRRRWMGLDLGKNRKEKPHTFKKAYLVLHSMNI